MRFNMLKSLLFSLLLSCALTLGYADTVDTTLSSDKIALGETVNISYTFNRSSANSSPDFSVLQKNFYILRTNYGNAVNMINGVTTVQTIWQLTLEPKVSGELVIPEISFGNDKSVSRKLTVTAITQSATNDNDAPIFVKAELSTTTPYVQGEVFYKLKLFYQSRLENLRIEPPKLKDAMLVEIGDGKNYQTTIKNKPFMVFEKNYAIFPQKAQEMVVPPTYVRAVTFDFSSNMANGPFFSNVTRPISLATQTFKLAVRKIPITWQSSTWLPAKNVSISDNWSTDRWEAGNPVSRTITVQAQGLRADQIPDVTIAKTAGVNIYVDPPQRSNTAQDNSVIGTWEQKVTYIPDTAQTLTIPAIKLNWWNTQSNTNAVAELAGLKVQVKAKVNNTVATPANNSAVSRSIDAPVQNAALAVPNSIAGYSFYRSIWFWIAIGLFVVWLFTLWVMLNKRMLKKPSLQPVADSPEPVILSDKQFEQACNQGEATVAQQFLLDWGKKQWQDGPLNLQNLREMTADNDFKAALADLEKAIYAKKTHVWDGQSLLAAYQRVKKSKAKNKLTIKQSGDPLPPLNP